MKKNYRIKIIYMLCLLTTAFSSCKKNELAEEKQLLGNHKNLAVAGDGKWDLLGHGYDMTGELFERENASDVSIIDIDRFNLDYPGRIVTPTDSKGGYNVYYGANASDYVKDINNKKTFGVSGTYRNSKSDSLYASANFSKTNQNQNTYTYSSKYSYATYVSWFRIKTIDFTGDATVDLLRNYLTPLFLDNLSNYSADALVERYGTHVLLGIDIGGRLKYDYKGSVVKETTYEQKLRAIKAGFSIGIAKIFSIDLSADVSKEEKTTISNETTDKLFRGTFYGGNNSGTSFSGDVLGNTSQSLNLVSWQQSININNASLININRSVPIYEFISDPVKKQQVKEAVEKYIADRQVKDLGDVPIYRYFNPTSGDHFYSQNFTVPAGYIFEGIEFYAFQNANNPNTVPIYSFFNSINGDHFYSRNANTPARGYIPEGIRFYAYSDAVNPNVVPIYRFYNSAVGVHFYSRNASIPNYYIPEGIAFYALN